MKLVSCIVFSFQRREMYTEADFAALPANFPAAVAMGTCHSLTIIQDKLVGDPLDVKMFEFLKWVTACYL
jgi:hypothetical protein